jgi:hypothetical protein
MITDYGSGFSRADAQCGHLTASICISDLQYGQTLVVGAAAGAGFFSLLITFINRKTTKARIRN